MRPAACSWQTRNSGILNFAIALLLPASVAAQISDMRPPRLVEFEISPTVVDVSTNDQTIILTARITDDLSGFGDPFPSSYARVIFKSPGSDLFAPAITLQAFPFVLRTSGDEFDGVYTSELFIPAHSRTGTWTVASFSLTDQARNTTNLITSDLRALGLPISFTVTGVEDRNPPEILLLSLEPATVDTSTTNATITITARVREDISWTGWYDEQGIPVPNFGSVQFLGPSKRQVVSANLSLEQISGDDHDGVFRTTLNLPQFSEPGHWQLLSVRLKDYAGNSQTIDLAGAVSRGLAVEFTVTGAGDTSPPTLRALDFFPRRIDTPTTNQTVTVTANYADDLAGFVTFDGTGRAVPSYSFLEFRSPSKLHTAQALLDPISTSGPLEVTSSGPMDFMKFCETGVWTLFRLTLRDGVGNLAQLDGETLRRLGYPTEIAVGITPSITISRQQNSIILSWPAWGADFHLQSRDLDTLVWSPVQAQPVIISDQLVISLPMSSTSQLFRLSE